MATKPSTTTYPAHINVLLGKTMPIRDLGYIGCEVRIKRVNTNYYLVTSHTQEGLLMASATVYLDEGRYVAERNDKGRYVEIDSTRELTPAIHTAMEWTANKGHKLGAW